MKLNITLFGRKFKKCSNDNNNNKTVLNRMSVYSNSSSTAGSDLAASAKCRRHIPTSHVCIAIATQFVTNHAPTEQLMSDTEDPNCTSGYHGYYHEGRGRGSAFTHITPVLIDERRPCRQDL